MNVFRRHHRAEGSCAFECPSPWRVVSRLFRWLKERRRPVQWRGVSDKESADGKSVCMSSLPLGADGGGHRVGSSVGIAKSDWSDTGKGGMFNLGVACSLLNLLASTKDELSKMNELRTNMEMLLQNVEEVRGKDIVSETSALKESPAVSCLTDLSKVSSCSSLLSSHEFTANLSQGEENITISSRSIVCDDSKKESVDGMEQLEAELKAELERLQLQLDTESSAQSIKITGSTAEGSGNFSLEEVIEPNEALMLVHGGVPPIVLERKLHELLESRQQERIKELEATIKHLTQKLSEKEREATMWKDTALLMSHDIPEPLDRS